MRGGLAALAVASALLFAAWLLGYNGFGVVDGAHLPLRVAQTTNAVPSELVEVRGPAGVATVTAANAVTGGVPNGEIHPGDGTSEFFGNQAGLSFWSLTGPQHLAWVGVRAVPALGLAVIWWLLARLVRDQRRGSGFHRRTAVRMAAIGALLLVGMPAVQIARWLVARWLIDSSSAARIVTVGPRWSAWLTTRRTGTSGTPRAGATSISTGSPVARTRRWSTLPRS